MSKLARHTVVYVGNNKEITHKAIELIENLVKDRAIQSENHMMLYSMALLINASACVCGMIDATHGREESDKFHNKFEEIFEGISKLYEVLGSRDN